MQSKQVLICVVQWDDGGESRLEIGGWSDCPRQKDLIRQHTIREAVGKHVELIEAVYFMSAVIPLKPTTSVFTILSEVEDEE